MIVISQPSPNSSECSRSPSTVTATVLKHGSSPMSVSTQPSPAAAASNSSTVVANAANCSWTLSSAFVRWDTTDTSASHASSVS